MRLIFKVPANQLKTVFPGLEHTPSHLAYIEWFTPFAQPGAGHGLHRVSYAMSNPGNEHIASVIELEDIQRSCHLWPDFGTAVPRQWSSDKVLDQCSSFFVSVFNDRYAYQTMV